MRLSIKSKNGAHIIKRIVICFIILAVGVIGMMWLTGLKKPPVKLKTQERPICVEAVRGVVEDVPVFITGYGEVRALDILSVAPEVSGKIVKINSRLEVGEVIYKGELLFEIDSRNYLSAEKQAMASVNQWKDTILRLEKEFAIKKNRLKTLKRNQELSKSEFKRVLSLFEKDDVGTRSGVDAAEQLFNNAAERADQMHQDVTLYPIRIREAQSSLTAATANLEIAATNLERCTVLAPFTARIKDVTLEKGQYVSPGFKAVTLANDAVLEINVPLNSNDARKWLRFNHKVDKGKTSWFNGLDNVICTIRWTENLYENNWTGRLNRVVKFDQETRTLTVAVRINAQDRIKDNKTGLPLVEGMFCAVKIPGKMLCNVIRMPRWTVSFENTVYVSIKNRLKTKQVTVARIDGKNTFISAGISPGEILITTRLIDPLENSLLEITKTCDSSDYFLDLPKGSE